MSSRLTLQRVVGASCRSFVNQLHPSFKLPHSCGSVFEALFSHCCVFPRQTKLFRLTTTHTTPIVQAKSMPPKKGAKKATKTNAAAAKAGNAAAAHAKNKGSKPAKKQPAPALERTATQPTLARKMTTVLDKSESDADDEEVVSHPDTETAEPHNDGRKTHYFVLHLWILPGGGRSDYACCGTFDEMMACLMKTLECPFNLHLQLQYGQGVTLDEYVGGKCVKSTNLLDYLEFRFCDVAGWTKKTEAQRIAARDAAAAKPDQLQQPPTPNDVLVTPKGADDTNMTVLDPLTRKPIVPVENAVEKCYDTFNGFPIEEQMEMIGVEFQERAEVPLHYEGYITNVPDQRHLNDFEALKKVVTSSSVDREGLEVPAPGEELAFEDVDDVVYGHLVGFEDFPEEPMPIEEYLEHGFAQ